MPPTWNDGMLESWNNGQKRITSVFCLSHQPYYFSTDGTRMYPIFHCSIIPIVSEANQFIKSLCSSPHSGVSGLGNSLLKSGWDLLDSNQGNKTKDRTANERDPVINLLYFMLIMGFLLGS